MKYRLFFKSNKKILALAATALCLSAGMAQASGSYSGGFSNNNGQAKAQYHKGKSLVQSKLLCSGCAMEGTKITRANAASVLQNVQANSALTQEDKEAVSTYLLRRYKIKN